MGYGAVGERVVNSALRIEAAPIYHIRTHRIHSYLRDALHLPVAPIWRSLSIHGPYAMAMSEAIQEMHWKRKYKRHNDWFLNN